MDDILAFVLGGIIGSLITLPYADNIKKMLKKMIRAVLREEKK